LVPRHEPPQHKQHFFLFSLWKRKKRSVKKKKKESIAECLLLPEGSVRARDTRRHLQEGNDASGAIDAVPRRDEFSPISSTAQETAGATSPTTTVLLVSHRTVTSNGTTTVTQENARANRCRHTPP
jgi:hypothetical protein